MGSCLGLGICLLKYAGAFTPDRVGDSIAATTAMLRATARSIFRSLHLLSRSPGCPTATAFMVTCSGDPGGVEPEPQGPDRIEQRLGGLRQVRGGLRALDADPSRRRLCITAAIWNGSHRTRRSE
jgi:hypothetical protein